MGTEVLWPQDLLNQRLRGPHASSSSSVNRRRNFPANENLPRLVVNNNNTNRKGTAGNGRKTSPKDEKRRFIAADDGPKKANASAASAVGREVTLLKRGESLDSLISRSNSGGGKAKSKAQPVDDLAVLGTARIGPESPEMSPTKIYLPVYAGSACSLSPSPKALPLPTFFSKKQNDSVSAAASPDTDSATRDLRRLLRLN